LAGVEAAASDQGYSVTFKRADNDPERQLEVLEALFRLNLAGIVIYPVDSNHVEPVLKLMEANYPVVLVDRYLRGVPTDYVISDHFGGALRATQHLIRLGHRRIGFISWSDPSISIEHRAMGYRSALAEAGIRFDPNFTIEVEGYPNVNVDQLCEFLSGPDRPTAIFVANDQIALATYDAARRVGVKIPDDLALVGFDNLDLSSHLDVPLTTVMQPAYDMGHVAVETLLKRINGEAEGWQQIILPTSLIVRQSCGAHLVKATGQARSTAE
jgi:DNA-binding LacI/PurR family transcriptional regulator